MGNKSTSKTVDYYQQYRALLNAALSDMTTDQLVTFGAISQQTAEEVAVPEGVHPYDAYLKDGRIQLVPLVCKIRAALAVCPYSTLQPKKVLAFVMRITGGTVDPNKVNAAIEIKIEELQKKAFDQIVDAAKTRPEDEEVK